MEGTGRASAVVFTARRHRLIVITVLAAATIGACDGGSSSPTAPDPVSQPAPTPPPATTTTSFQGVVSGSGGLSGTLEVAIATRVASVSPWPAIFEWVTVRLLAAVHDATGVLRLEGGGSINLSGNYDDGTRQLTLSGEGYAFEGTFDPDEQVLSGSFSGPDTSGGFSTLDAGSGSVTKYCGTFSGDGASGVWNLAFSASGRVTGVAHESSDQAPVQLTGRVSGSTFTVSGSDQFGSVSGSGTIQDGAVSGTFETSDGDSASFSGRVCD